GLRIDPEVNVGAQTFLVPLAVEVQYNHNFWSSFDQSGGDAIADGALAGEGMELDSVQLMLSIGWMR
ncbi:MAG: hypothetical protein KC561_10865, partial [Myxococcales bacterium]|nr:hypothetical protein [Myxococcales bacterium]